MSKQELQDFNSMVDLFKKSENDRLIEYVKELEELGFSADIEIPLYKDVPLLIIRRKK